MVRHKTTQWFNKLHFYRYWSQLNFRPKALTKTEQTILYMFPLTKMPCLDIALKHLNKEERVIGFQVYSIYLWMAGLCCIQWE